MVKPIKYKLYNGWLWVRWGLDEEWKQAQKVTGKSVSPITQGFGEDFIWSDPNKPQWVGKWFYKDILNIPGHNGLDWVAPTGTRLYAPHDGKIVELPHQDSIAIRLLGDGYESLFLHLKEWHCSLNQEVKKGDFLALTDNTGLYTTAPHLHWMVRPIGGQWFDHKSLIDNLEVKMLPYQEGQCLLVLPDGQFYVVENGELVYYDSEKQPDKHIPLVDFFIKKSRYGLPPNFIRTVEWTEFQNYKDLIK